MSKEYNSQLVSALDNLTRAGNAHDSVNVPLDLLVEIKAQLAKVTKEIHTNTLAHNTDDSEGGEDAILEDVVQDLDVRSTLRQTFSTNNKDSPTGTTHNRQTRRSQQRRSSSESLRFIRQLLRTNNNHKNLRDFILLSWHLCQRNLDARENDEPVSLPSVQVEEGLTTLYDHICDWGVDVLQIRRLLGGGVGSELVFVVLSGVHKMKLGQFTTGFDSADKVWKMYAKLANYVWAVADTYLNNAYHNVAHAADVTQTCLAMLGTPQSRGLASVLSEDQQLAFILAACVHDAGHLGVNNHFLCSTSHPLALRYNDYSPLEQLHCALGFELMQNYECNFLSNLKTRRPDDYSKMRRLMIKLVLGTDMSHHFKSMAALKAIVDQESTSPVSRPVASAEIARHKANRMSNNTANKASKAGRPESKPSVSKTVSLATLVANQKDNDVVLILKECIHAADISNPAKPWPLCQYWTDRVMTEFFNQGDRERSLNLPISHGMDRMNPIPLPKFQIGFIKALVQPL